MVLKKRTKLAVGVTLGAPITLAPWVALPASADDDGLAEAQTALSNSNGVAVLDGVKPPSDYEAVQEAVNATHNKVAVVYALGDQEYLVRPNATKLVGTSGYETVVLVKGKNSVQIASSNPNVSSQISSLNPGEGIPALVAELDRLSQTSTSTTVPGETPNYTGAIVGGGSVLVAAVVIAAVIARRFKTTQPKQPNYTEYVKGFPETLKPYTTKLYQLTKKHAELGSKDLSSNMLKVISNIQVLFQKIDKKAPEKRGIAEVEYKDKLSKLVSLLDEEHYINMVKYPEQWEEPDSMISDIRVATDSVYEEIMKNIRQVNASKDLDFKVALGTLLSATNTPTVKDIYNPEKKENKK